MFASQTHKAVLRSSIHTLSLLTEPSHAVCCVQTLIYDLMPLEVSEVDAQVVQALVLVHQLVNLLVIRVLLEEGGGTRTVSAGPSAGTEDTFLPGQASCRQAEKPAALILAPRPVARLWWQQF